MVDKFVEMGNPFVEDSMTLFTLDTKEIMIDSVVNAMTNAHSRGTAQLL